MKFSIRDLFLVTVILALAVGWLRDAVELRTEKGELKAALLDAVQQAVKCGLDVETSSDSPKIKLRKPALRQRIVLPDP